MKPQKYITEKGIGRVKINYRLRDAIFSRQRYWGEPIPIYYKWNALHAEEEELPLARRKWTNFPRKGEPPLARAKNWKTKDGYPLEVCTMPGFAGSSAYYLRLGPKNDKALVSPEANQYWRNVILLGWNGTCNWSFDLQPFLE